MSRKYQQEKVAKMGQLCAKQGENTSKAMPYKGERPPTPPTPRQLKDVLTSSARSNEFHAYLADMDKTHEEYTKQTYLNFALKCNELRKAANSKEAEKILAFMSSEFFSNPTRAKRLALRNEVTRDQCKKYLENKPDSSKIPQHLWDAENEAHSHLANHCQDFLNKQYRERSNS